MLYSLGKSVVICTAFMTIGFTGIDSLNLEQLIQPRQAIATNHATTQKCGCNNSGDCFPCPD